MSGLPVTVSLSNAASRPAGRPNQKSAGILGNAASTSTSCPGRLLTPVATGGAGEASQVAPPK